MTFLKGMYDEGCAYFFTEGFPNPQFAARKGIFAMGSTSGIPFYAGDVATAATENRTEPDAWGVAAIPHTTAEPVQNIYGGDVMITKTTPEQELAAWLFIKWFTTPEVQARVGRDQRLLPDPRGDEQNSSPMRSRPNPPGQQGVALLPYSAYEPQFISYTACAMRPREGVQRDHAGSGHPDHAGQPDDLRQ
jgi:ABC-type glycerol-3-phosphate transport system substrate-binding protein